MAPVRLAGREFQDADSVRADRSMEQMRRRMVGRLQLGAAAPGQSDAPLELAAQLITEERAAEQQVIGFSVAGVRFGFSGRWNAVCWRSVGRGRK